MLYVVLCTLVAAAAAVCDDDLNCKYGTMHQDQFIDYFNGLNYSFQIALYPFPMFYSPSVLSNQEQFFTKDITPLKTKSYKTHGPELLQHLPKSFDSRKKWPQCPSIEDDGHISTFDCNPWHLVSANIATDRNCIHNNISVNLAPTDLRCCRKCYSTILCAGGSYIGALNFWLKSGLVTSSCKPFNVSSCDQYTSKPCPTTCANSSINYMEDKHYAKIIYRLLPDVDLIKAELVNNGPVLAVMNTYEDFYLYKSGVYQHTFGESQGSLGVRIIGYGTERGIDYWLAARKGWGLEWGDHGKFKIAQRTQGIEAFIMSGLPKKL